MRLSVRLLTVLVLFAVLQTVTSPCSAAPTDLDESTGLRLINTFRRLFGRKELKTDPTLIREAQIQADDMAGRKDASHHVAGKLSFKDRAKRIFGKWGEKFENIFAGPDSITSAMAGWKKSFGHMKNMLKEAITHVGIASRVGPDNKRYWAMIGGQKLDGDKNVQVAKSSDPPAPNRRYRSRKLKAKPKAARPASKRPKALQTRIRRPKNAVKKTYRRKRVQRRP